MRYPKKLSKRADEILAARRQTAQERHRSAMAALNEQHPEINAAGRELARLYAQRARASLTHDQDTSEMEEAIRAAQSRRAAALAAAGVTEADLEPAYTCPLCRDRGVKEGGQMCECRQVILNQLVYEQLCDVSPARECSFENFELRYYDEKLRPIMRKVVESSQRYASVFQSELDKAAVEQATSGWMELNDKLVRYNGGAEVKIPNMDMDGLADYDRDTGFVEGSVSLKWQTKEMTQDRGRQFTFDENEVNETNFVVTAAQVMGEFQRTKVIPEIDAYRYSKIAALCTAKERVGYGYTATEDDILKKLYYDIAAVQDVVGDETPLVITMSRPVAAIFDMSSTLSKSLSVMDFKQGDVTVKVKSLNGEHPILRVGSGRMKTSYIFNDGTTGGQEKGGFTAAEGAQDINWIICPRTAPIAVSRTDKVRIFDPETYQKKRAWATDYRKYHDLWVPDNKLEAMWVNIKQAKAGVGG